MQSSILSAPHAPEFVARPARLAGRPQRLVVVSSRADPCAGLHEDASTRTIRDALAEHGGVWLGWSGRVDDARMFHVRREGRIRCVAGDLSAEEHCLGYAGYAARTLWPLLHGRLDLVAFDREWLRGYRQINERFADSVARLTEPGDLVWIHDHHLIPLGRALRDRGIDAAIGFFLHAPVPPPETLAALPEHARLFPLLEACDVVGVQTAGDARHLKDYLQSRVARMPRIEVCPAGIDVAAATALAEEAAARPRADAPRLLIGVDRLDGISGLPLRLQAFRRLLEAEPALRGETAYLQIAQRGGATDEDRHVEDEVQTLAEHINGRYAEPAWTPIRCVTRRMRHSEIIALLRKAKVGVVTPLRDGMSPVAQAYVAAQDPHDPGALVLSEFSGAAGALRGALLVNPYDVDGCAQALREALAMPLEERRERWADMMRALRRDDVFAWRDRFLASLAGPQQPPAWRDAPMRARGLPLRADAAERA
jgi:trehalose 6-phosphate synthase